MTPEELGKVMLIVHRYVKPDGFDEESTFRKMIDEIEETCEVGEL